MVTWGGGDVRCRAGRRAERLGWGRHGDGYWWVLKGARPGGGRAEGGDEREPGWVCMEVWE